MIEINKVLGNIFQDGESKNTDNFEKLKIARRELEKQILRRKTDQGTDVGLRLKSGIRLQHGDIIKDDDVKIVIEQIPEKVISVKLKEKKNIEFMTMIGHMIGNMHRPISINGDEILFPIQADSEKETFEKIFSKIDHYIELSIQQCVFVPYLGVSTHEH